MKLLTFLYHLIKTTLQLGLVVTALVVAGVFFGGKSGLIPEVTPFIVLSGSMEPRVKTGSVVLVWPNLTYSIGDIITFSGSTSDQFTTHRIMQVFNDGGEITYQTQGDANKNPDAIIVPKEKVKGKVIAHLPYVGYAASMSKEPKGFIALVIIPATIVVYEELRTMLRELKRAIFGKKKKRSKKPAITLAVKDSVISHPSSVIHDQVLDQATVVSQSSDTMFPIKQTESYAKARGITAPLPPANHPLMTLFQSLPQASLSVSVTTPTPRPSPSPGKKVSKPQAAVSPFKLIPIITAVAVFVGVSGSYFLDHEISFDNILAAGTWSAPEPPDPTHYLVINEIMPATTCLQGQIEASWLEIFNGLPEPVNLKDYQLSDGVQTVRLIHAGNIVVPPQGMVVLAHSHSIFGHNKCWPDPSVQIVNLGDQPNLNTGILQLLNPQGEIIDTVKWGSGQTHQPLTGQSFERSPTGWDTAYGGDYNPDDFTIPTTPSPGY